MLLDRAYVAPRYGVSKCYSPTHNLVTTIESSLWWLFVGITQIAVLRIYAPFERRMRIITSAWCTLIIEEDCFIVPKIYQAILLFETLLTYRFERLFSRLFAGSPFSPTLSQSEVIVIAALLSIVFNGLS
jgi:hypothetical protein